MAQLLEIRLVIGAVRQTNVEGRLHLAERIIALPMHGKGEGTRIALEDRRSTVALVNVEINDQCAFDLSVTSQDSNSHGKEMILTRVVAPNEMSKPLDQFCDVTDRSQLLLFDRCKEMPEIFTEDDVVAQRLIVMRVHQVIL